MSQDELYERIDQYLKGQLDPGDALNFEEELRENVSLHTKVEHWKLANDLILEHRIASATQALRNIHSASLRKKLLLRIVFVTVALGIVFLVWMILSEKKEVVQKQEVRNEHETPASTLPPADKLKNVPVPASSKTSIKHYRPDAQRNERPVPPTERSALHPETTVSPSETDLNIVLPLTAPEQAEVRNPCMDSDIEVSFHTVPSCKEKASGRISINTIRGGEKPYLVKIVNHDGEEFNVSQLLPPGNYQLKITDHKNCHHQESFSVSATVCPIDHAFNPFLGEHWELPEAEQNGVLSIIDPNGKTIFEKQLYGGSHNSWDGSMQQGTLKPGYYIYNIRYEDQSVVTGTLTLLE